SCIDFGGDCDGEKDDCQCCRSNGYCSCYNLFGYLRSGCKCEVGTSAEFRRICRRKAKQCYNSDPDKCVSVYKPKRR
nr:omega-Aga-IIIB-35R=8.637 kda type III omega-agatoxin [Agelenopsis aperta=funnel web spiders, venom, Peptide Mutant, 76 aa] [Agelenopsis aperta]